MGVAFIKTGLKFLIGFLLLFSSFLISGAVFAADYVSLIKIPGLAENSSSIPGFVNTVYKITIGLGALFGVIKIAFAGVKYSMSDVVTDKTGAKKDILGVLLGLAILLTPYIILNTIYPGLLDLNIAEKLNEAAPDLGGVKSGSSGSGGLDSGWCYPWKSYTDGGLNCYTTYEACVAAAPPNFCFLKQTETGTQNEIANCQSQAGSQWDPYCSTCVLKTGVLGEVCGYEPSGTSVTYPCSIFSLAEGQSCQDFCALLGGTYNPDDSCTYGGG